MSEGFCNATHSAGSSTSNLQGLAEVVKLKALMGPLTLSGEHVFCSSFLSL